MRRLLWTAIFAHVAILTVLPVLPAQVPALLGPSPLLAQAVATDERARVVVDTAVLMRDLRILAADSMEGRAVGTPGNAKARAHLLRRFSEVQLRPFGSSFEKPFTFTPRGSEQQQRGVNVVGYIRGTASPERYIVVTAHYDHLGISNGEIFNGADDNASGTAALFAVAEHFRRDPAAHSLIIAALDAEEVGLRGAHAFVQDPPVDRAAIVANVNMDMVGRNDAGELWAAGTYHNPGLRPLVERLAGRAPVTLRIGHDRPNVPGEDDWTNASDHGPFHAAGIPFLYFGVEDHEDYHKPTDEADRIDADFYGRAVATVIEALRELDAFLARGEKRGLSAAQEPELSTFSIVACDPAQGFWGVGIQSRVVGAGSIVPAAEAGVGAIASQAAANVAYKRQALELLRQGRSPQEIRDHFVATDAGSARRQFALTDAQCRIAAFTGDSTLAWAGHRVGRGYSAQGNILAGPQVVDAMAAAYERADAEGWPFGERILAALKAGQDAGGDTRGRQGAGLLIVKEAGGYGGGDDRYADLRVEDHVEPILELERVYNVWMSVFHPADHFAPAGRQPIAAPVGPHVCELRRLLTAAGFDSYDGRPGCAFDEQVITALKAFQRAAGLPERAALTPEVVQALRERADGRR